MAKSRHRKKHKQKVNSRIEKKVGDENRIKRVQREMYEQIVREMKNGKFEGTPEVPNTENTKIDDNDIELEL